MLPSGWLAAGSAIAITAAAIGGYLTGKQAGADGVRAEQLEDLKRQIGSRDALQDSIDEHERAAASGEQARAQEVRYVYREIPRVVAGEPVYRNVCLGSDGLSLLDRAAAAANAQPSAAPAPAGGAGTAADRAADDRSRYRQGQR